MYQLPLLFIGSYEYMKTSLHAFILQAANIIFINAETNVVFYVLKKTLIKFSSTSCLIKEKVIGVIALVQAL